MNPAGIKAGFRHFLGAVRSRPGVAGAALLLTGAFWFCYRNVLVELVTIWMRDGNYSHGFFVPVIVGYIIWSRREELQKTPVKPYWPAILLILFAGIILLGGQLTIHRFSRFTSLFFMFFALPLFILGKEWLKKLLLPLAFLAFMFPLPELLRRTVTGPLQLLSSRISVEILQVFNFTVFRQGNVIELPSLTLSVAEACSGLRSLVALTFLAAVAGYFLLEKNWKRLILFLAAIPIAILLNWTRITGTVILADIFGREAALGFFHEFSGLVIFGLATALIGMIIFFLQDGAKTKSPQRNPDPVLANDPSSGGLSPGLFLIPALLLVIITLGTTCFNSLKPGPVVDLQDFPLHIGPYEGRKEKIPEEVTEASSVTQDLSIVFRHHGGLPPIVVYLGYYRTDKSLEGFFHGPGACLPGSGWNIKTADSITIPSLDGNSGLEVTSFISTRKDRTQVMFNWLQMGDLVGPINRMTRVRYAWKILTGFRYDDLTKIMVQTELGDGENEQEATGRLITFLREFYPRFRIFFRIDQERD